MHFRKNRWKLYEYATPCVLCAILCVLRVKIFYHYVHEGWHKGHKA